MVWSVMEPVVQYLEQEDHAEETVKKKTNADWCRKYKAKMRATESYKGKERDRIARWRAEREVMETEDARAARLKKDAERKKEARRRKKTTAMTPNSHVSPYQRPQSLGKAVSRVVRHLPYSPRKRALVFTGVARKIGVHLESKMTEQITEKRERRLSMDTVECIKTFYTNPDIVYTMPGMRDEMTVWEEGKKMKMRKYYLTVFLREAYSMYEELHPNNTVGFSKFCSLRPKNVLLLHDTPADQCRCKVHENLILKLKGLQIKYDSTTFWESVLCDTSLNSNCWQSKCQECTGGKKIAIELDLAQHVSWREWEVPATDTVLKRLKCVIHEGCAGELKELLIDDFPTVVRHINIKRIQARQFQEDQSNPNVRILQADFAMNYSCEYQDEVQSALWSRASVTLFTAAAMHDGQCKTFLICSNTKEKTKDTVAVFLDHLYENHLIPDTPVSSVEEVIWTDGPSSEFKNKFMIHLIRLLSAKYQRKFTWRYFATSHGKGVVDGVGGRAKSLVRTEVMSKKSDKTVVQSSEDFSNVASRLMRKTTVIHIPQEEIDCSIKVVSWADAVAVPGIQKMHVASCSLGGIRVNIYEHALSSHVIRTVQNHDADPVCMLEGSTTTTSSVDLSVGDWCVVVYDNEQFPGEVTNITCGEYEVSVMHRSGKYFKWPTSVDKIHYPLSSIVKKISGPVMVTKMGPRILSQFEDFN